MDFKKAYTLIKSYSYISDNFFNTFGHTKPEMLFDSLLFTAFAIEGNFVDAIADIDFTLIEKGGAEINLKDYADSDQFVKYTDNDNVVHAVYAGNKNLNSALPEGEYYLKIEDSADVRYTDSFIICDTVFQGIVASANIHYNKPVTTSDIDVTIKIISDTASKIVNISWGDGTDTDVNIGLTQTTITKTYTAANSQLYDIVITGNIGNIESLVLENDFNDTSTDKGKNELFTFSNFSNLTGLKVFDLKMETKTPPFSQLAGLDEVYYRKVTGTLYVSQWNGIDKHKATLTTLYTDNFAGYTNSTFLDYCKQLINLTSITVSMRRQREMFYSDNAGRTFDDIATIDLSNNSLTAMPLIGYSNSESYVNLENFDLSNNKIQTVLNVSESEFEYFFGNINTKNYNFSNNAISLASIDKLLEYANEYVDNPANLTLDLSGFCSVGANATPTNEISVIDIVNVGATYQVGDTFVNGDITLTVTGILPSPSFGIATLEITSNGTGYTSVVDTWTVTTSAGTGADIEAYSYYAKLVADGATVTTN